jgi:hypothetical protein
MPLGGVEAWSPTQPKRLLIDAMVVDGVLATPGLLQRIQDAHARGALVIVTTHLLKDQLAETKDEARRLELLAVYDALPKTHVATAGFVLDVSRLGEAALSADAGAASLSRLKTPGRGGMHDALLAMTASGHADALVTEDGDLVKRVGTEKIRCAVWSFGDFRSYVEDGTKDGPKGGS